MRTIKFRYLWKGKWYYINFEKDNLAIKWKLYESRAKTTFPEQFTGVLDKNDVEIYTGDILTNGHNNYECIFWKGSFVANLIGSEKKKEQGYLALEILRKIGNIYEKPELKEAQKDGNKSIS